MESNSFLKMIHISKSFPGVKALNDVSFSVEQGEIHALVGENGAGKSALMKILIGLYQPDEGEIVFDGKSRTFRQPADALKAGISMIHQEISLMQKLTVAENIWMGREREVYTKWKFLIDEKMKYQATKALLDTLSINLDPNTVVGDLSIAEMQLVEICRAVSYDAKLIIMDEPTSALSQAEIEILYTIVKGLADKGVSCVFISHKFDEVFELSQRITVLRDGAIVGTYATDAIDSAGLIKLMVNREITELFPKRLHQIKADKPGIEVKGLSSDETMLKDVSFYAKPGEVVGFCGLMGSGRTEIMRAIFGLDRYTSGEIYIDEELKVIRSPQNAVKNGLAMVSEDRLRLGCLPKRSVRENLSASYIKRISRWIFINSKLEKKQTEKMQVDLRIKVSNLSQKISQLSGGNQQKVILGRWLLTAPKVFILDEPTRGIDVGSKREIYALINTLASEGLVVLLVSSELPELMGLSDRIYVVKDGRIVSEHNPSISSTEKIMQDAFGA